MRTACLAADEEGRLVDGDHIMAILASDMMERGRLKQSKIAVTTYSNLGLKTALEALGAGVVETKAGDRYVLEAMLDQGLVLGGEQSGHIILLEHNTTGDGLLTCLALLDVMTRKAQPLSALARVMQAFPRSSSTSGWPTKGRWPATWRSNRRSRRPPI